MSQDIVLFFCSAALKREKRQFMPDFTETKQQIEGKASGSRRISFEMQGARAETKRSMPEHVSIGFRESNAADRRKDKWYTILSKSLILAQDERWRRA